MVASDPILPVRLVRGDKGSIVTNTRRYTVSEVTKEQLVELFAQVKGPEPRITGEALQELLEHPKALTLRQILRQLISGVKRTAHDERTKTVDKVLLLCGLAPYCETWGESECRTAVLKAESMLDTVLARTALEKVTREFRVEHLISAVHKSDLSLDAKSQALAAIVDALALQNKNPALPREIMEGIISPFWRVQARISLQRWGWTEKDIKAMRRDAEQAEDLFGRRRLETWLAITRVTEKIEDATKTHELFSKMLIPEWEIGHPLAVVMEAFITAGAETQAYAMVHEVPYEFYTDELRKVLVQLQTNRGDIHQAELSAAEIKEPVHFAGAWVHIFRASNAWGKDELRCLETATKAAYLIPQGHERARGDALLALVREVYRILKETEKL